MKPHSTLDLCFVMQSKLRQPHHLAIVLLRSNFCHAGRLLEASCARLQAIHHTQINAILVLCADRCAGPRIASTRHGVD
jgi:hypothetical protein